MTHQEFTSRVKSESLKNVEAELYTKVIEPIYYMVDSDKDFFCSIFDKAFGKLMGDDNAVDFLKELAWFYKSGMEYEKKMDKEKVAATKEIMRLENALIYNDLEEVVGIPKAELIRRKVSMGLSLTDDQRQYIVENLK